MLFLVVLLAGTALAAAVLWIRRRFSTRQAARLGMAAAMTAAGVTHWLQPTPFFQHLPSWVPMREELVLASGVAEVALGVALLSPQPWRKLGGQALAAYLVAVFPANVYVAVAGVDVEGQPGGPYPWIRLPFQGLFIAWALWSTREGSSAASGGRRRPGTPSRSGPTRGSTGPG